MFSLLSIYIENHIISMRKTERIVYLLRRHLEGVLSQDERDELNVWTAESEANRKLLDEISNPVALFRELNEIDNAYGDNKEASIARMYKRIDAEISRDNSQKNHSIINFRKWLPYVAAILLFAAVGAIYWRIMSVDQQENLYAVDVEPGGTKAMLTLPDGNVINLREDQGYIVLGEEGMLYSDGTQVLTGARQSLPESELNYMSISVPKGGTYQVVMSDGTKVWLNSSSTLRYPERFVSSRRLVELEGEAYFEVNSIEKNSHKVPFVVKTKEQEIEVLGTQFNVSAYSEQQGVVTTLVEGSVAVMPNADPTQKFLLKPGYQSVVNGNNSSIDAVEIEQYIAWKDGRFHFKNTSFEDMMVQISRWYDVEVIYKGKVPKETFTGKMGRDLSLMTILELLNVSNVSVSMEGKSLIVR